MERNLWKGTSQISQQTSDEFAFVQSKLFEVTDRLSRIESDIDHATKNTDDIKKDLLRVTGRIGEAAKEIRSQITVLEAKQGEQDANQNKRLRDIEDKIAEWKTQIKLIRAIVSIGSTCIATLGMFIIYIMTKYGDIIYAMLNANAGARH